MRSGGETVVCAEVEREVIRCALGENGRGAKPVNCVNDSSDDEGNPMVSNDEFKH